MVASTQTQTQTTTSVEPPSEEPKQQPSESSTYTTPAPTPTPTTLTTKPKKVRRIIRRKGGARKGGGSSTRRKGGGRDDDAGIDPVLFEKVMTESNLPSAYSFEITKSVQRINQLLQLKVETHKQTQKMMEKEQAQATQEGTKAVMSSVSVHIALQMPEGLLLYATVLSDVLQRLVMATNTKTVIEHHIQHQLLSVSVLGDVTYGACCVDDLGARTLGCDLLIHYGHSCLVPIQHTVIPCLYVFVEITIDVPHLVECFHQTILQLLKQQQQQGTKKHKPHVYLLGTIQFRHALMEARRLLRNEDTYNYQVSIPQAKPLSPGEVLGCTSPVLTSTPPSPSTSTKNKRNKNKISSTNTDTGGDDEDVVFIDTNDDTNNTEDTDTAVATAVVLFIADGRFHLESTMISNPHIDKFYRYDPYPKSLTEESYDHLKMKSIRYEAITKARTQMKRMTVKATTNNNNDNNITSSSSRSCCCVFGIILGTLGRQGNPALLTKIQTQLSKRQGVRSFVMLASEITPSKLALFANKVQVWVQIACPRLSVDWGHHLSGNQAIPVLNPYELFVCLNIVPWRGSIPNISENGSNNHNDSNGIGNNTNENEDKSYPMDYYSQDGGPWSNYGDTENKNRKYTALRT